jgi:hypothetical protein
LVVSPSSTEEGAPAALQKESEHPTQPESTVKCLPSSAADRAPEAGAEFYVENSAVAHNTGCCKAQVPTTAPLVPAASTSKALLGSSSGAAAHHMLKLGPSGFSSCVIAAPRMNPTYLMSMVRTYT